MSDNPAMAGALLAKGSLDALFAVPTDHWTAVSERAGWVHVRGLLGAPADDWGTWIAWSGWQLPGPWPTDSGLPPIASMPSFDAYDSVCYGYCSCLFPSPGSLPNPCMHDPCWDEQGYPAPPDIATFSAQLVAYCATARAQCAAMQAHVGGLQPNDPLPPGLAAVILHSVAAIQSAARGLRTALSGLLHIVTGFAEGTAEVDAWVAANAPAYTDMLARLNTAGVAVSDAAGLIEGVVKALADDLDDAIATKVEATTQVILGLDLAVTVQAWTHLESEAESFGSLATDQWPWAANFPGGRVPP
jgi:hypothetical protein